MAKEKISSQEIVELLAEQAEITKKSAEEFLKAMISTIEEALLAGDSVKIKKFGTFKLQKNAPRKSVNVQTGEKIVISGYYKVNFTPDVLLKEAVNEPFSHLDSVKLDEHNVPTEPSEPEVLVEDYTQMGAFTEQAKEIKDILSEIHSLSGDDKSSEEPKEASPVLPSPAIETETPQEDAVEKEEPVEQVEPEPIEEKPVEVAAAKAESNEAHIVESEPKEELEVSDVDVSKNIVAAAGTPPTVTGASFVDAEGKGVKKKRKSKAWWIILIVLFVIIAGGISAYYTSSCVKCWVTYDLMSDDNQQKFDDCRNKVAGWFSSDEKAEPASVELVDPIDTVAVVEEFVEEELPVDSLQMLFDTERVYSEYLGAERIRNGSSLTRFALRYYGNREYWVYIYEANRSRIDDPNNIKIGTLIRVPKLDPKLIDTNNPRSIEYAKKLHDLYVQ